jgi:hypothetical protein
MITQKTLQLLVPCPAEFPFEGEAMIVDIRELRSRRGQYGVFAGDGWTPLSPNYDSEALAKNAWLAGFPLPSKIPGRTRRIINTMEENHVAQVVVADE